MERQIAKRSANVGVFERMDSIIAGGFLLTRVFSKPSPARLLASALGADLLYRGITGHCSFYSVPGVNTAIAHRAGSRISPGSPMVKLSLTISTSPEELYTFWRDPDNMAKLISPVAEATSRTDGFPRWRVRGPTQQTFEWKSRYNERRPQSLEWESLPESTLVNRGKISFKPEPDGIGIQVTLSAHFEPPMDGACTCRKSGTRSIPDVYGLMDRFRGCRYEQGSRDPNVQTTVSHVLPDTVTAEMHRKQSEPGSAER